MGKIWNDLGNQNYRKMRVSMCIFTLLQRRKCHFKSKYMILKSQKVVVYLRGQTSFPNYKIIHLHRSYKNKYRQDIQMEYVHLSNFLM